MTTIRYFIPEDGDQEHQPNVFLAPKSRQQGYPPTLEQVKSTFPLPGKYHFRFKSSLTGGNNGAEKSSSNLAVWMDCTDDRLPVPVYQSQIIAKVTRIGVEEDDDDEDDEDFRRPTAAATSLNAPSVPNPTVAAMGVPLSQPPPPQQQRTAAPPPPRQQQQHQPVVAPSFDLFGDSPVPPSNTSNQQSHNMSVNLFDTPHPASSASGGSSSLLDMNYQQHNNSSTAHSDFLGMTTAPSPPVSGNGNNMYGAYPQQQQQQQQRPFGSSGSGGGAFGDLAWK